MAKGDGARDVVRNGKPGSRTTQSPRKGRAFAWLALPCSYRFRVSRSAEEDPISLIFVPILAQALTFGTGARTEVRYVVTNERREPVEDHFEFGAGAGVGLNFTADHFSLGVGYAPSVSISPLLSEGTEGTLTHTGFANAGAGYEFKFKRMRLAINQTANYSVHNSSDIAIAGPTALPLPTPETPRPSEETPPDGTPAGPDGEVTPPDGQGEPGAGGPAVNPDGTRPVDRGTEGELLHMGSLTTSLQLTHLISRKTTLTEGVGYSLSVGLGGRSREFYALVQGIYGNVSYGYRLGARDTITTALNTGHAWSELGNEGQVVALTVTWGHTFTRQLEGYIGGGAAYTRTQYRDDPVPNSIYPTANAGINYHTRLARGALNMNANFSAAPVLDYTTANVDPQLSFNAGVGWSRDRTGLSASFGSAISVSQPGEAEPQGALNSFYASAGASYDIGAGFAADAGVRAAWLEYDDFESVPPQFAIYVGLSWGAGVSLLEPTSTREPTGR
jgi:hypothetical protein